VQRWRAAVRNVHSRDVQLIPSGVVIGQRPAIPISKKAFKLAKSQVTEQLRPTPRPTFVVMPRVPTGDLVTAG
jgi:hypothetical protein